jgi:hypothetical protein
VLLAIVFVLSSFLDNIAAAIIGGTVARYVFGGKVHIGYLAAIVAASNAGGSGSVVGDTTTTMMWVSGVSPLSVLEAYVAAIVAFVIFAVPASLQQERHLPIVKHARRGVEIDWMRVFIVAAMLIVALLVNVVTNLHFPELLARVPILGLSVWAVLFATSPLRRPDWKVLPETFKGTIFLLALVTAASMMPVEELPAASWRTALGLGFVSAVFDNIPLTALALKQGLGLSCLRGWIRRLNDLVRFFSRGSLVKPVFGGKVGRSLASPRLARGGRLCGWVFRHAGSYRMAPRRSETDANHTRSSNSWNATVGPLADIRAHQQMSAFGAKADISQAPSHVCC